MFTKKSLEKIREDSNRWQELFREFTAKAPERLKRFSTVSDRPIKNLYTPLDIEDGDFTRDIGFPAQYHLHEAFSRLCTAANSGQ